MYILHTTCPACGELHAVQILPALARDELRDDLASAHEALGAVAATLQQRNQEGWEERLLAVVTKALKKEAR